MDPEKIAAQLIASGVQNHVVTPDQEALQARLSVPDNAGLEAYAHAYLDAQETPLDKRRLVQVFEELVR